MFTYYFMLIFVFKFTKHFPVTLIWIKGHNFNLKCVNSLPLTTIWTTDHDVKLKFTNCSL
jgi:hypothetical protein